MKILALLLSLLLFSEAFAANPPAGAIGSIQVKKDAQNVQGVPPYLIRGIPPAQYSSVIAYGDHNTIAPNTPPPGSDYGTLISTDMNAAYTNKGLDQTQTCDSLDLGLIYSQQPANTGNPLYLFLPSNGDQTYAVSQPQQLQHLHDVNLCYQAAMAWIGTPTTSKVFGQNASCVQTGTWTNDTAFGGTTGVESAVNGSTLACTITSNGSPLYIWYRQHTGDGGTFTYAVDGGTVSASVPTAPQFAAGLAFGGLNGQYGGGLIRIPGIATGTHTITVNVTSSTSASNNVFVLGVGTAPALAYQGGGPTIFSTTMLYNQNNANASLSAQYDTAFTTDVSQLKQDGLNVNIASVKPYMNYTSDFSNVVNLTVAGEMHVRDAFEGKMQFIKNVSASSTVGVVDPRNYGASCNTKSFLNGVGFPTPSTNNSVTTTSGSAVISIAGYTFNSATATQTGGGDVGKKISIMGVDGGNGGDVMPTTYIASVNTINNTATLGATAYASTTNGMATMGGYPTNPSDPSTAIDDGAGLTAAANAANAIGAKVYLPPHCGVVNWTPPEGTWLDGAMGGTDYDSLAPGDLTNTPLYYFSNGYAEDKHLGINLFGVKNVRLSNFSSQCSMYPYLGYSGLTFSAIGSEQNADLAPEGILLEHVSHILCPVEYGVPFGMNQGVAFTASISSGSMSVSAITSTNFNTAYGGYTAINGDWLAPNRTVNLLVATGSIGSGTLTLTAVSAGAVAVGEVITNGNATTYGTVTAFLTGTGGTGTYSISGSSTVGAGSFLESQATILTSPSGGKAGTYTISPAVTLASQSFYSLPINVFLSGQTRFNQFSNGGIDQNGDFSDFADVGSVFTDGFAKCLYLGPNTGGSTGNSANRWTATRFEECNSGAVVLDGSYQDQFNGVQWQFNPGYAIETRTAWEDITITGGLLEGNGSNDANPPTAPLLSQVSLGGTGSGFSLDGIDWVHNNYSTGGNSSYLISNASGSTVDYVSINGGAAKNGYTVGVANWAGGVPTHYKQNSAGLPYIDTTQTNLNVTTLGLVGAPGFGSNGTKFTTTGCSISATTGGATSGTFTSGTTGTCTAVITMNGATGLTAPNGWGCFANDETTPADKLTTSAHTTTTATLLGTTVSGDVISFGCMAY